MKFITSLFTVLFLINSPIISAQTDYENVDWRALNYFTNDSIELSIEECRSLLKTKIDGIPKNRASFILARGLMEKGEYNEAIKLLSTLKFEATLLKSGVFGLIGDCKSEQKKYAEALEFYKKATHAEWNEGTTPLFLFKAYLCADKLDRFEEGQQYIQTIVDYFPGYSGFEHIEKHLVLDDVTRIELVKSPITQPSELGIGTINGQPVNPREFDEAIEIAQINSYQAAQQQGTQPQLVDEDRVWNSFVIEKLRQTQYDLLALTSDNIEVMAYLMATDGYSVQREFLNSPAFTDEYGIFQSNILLARINEMKSATDPDQIEAWQTTEDYYKQKLLFEKCYRFMTMIVFVSSLEVDRKVEDQRSYAFNYRIEKEDSSEEMELAISDEDTEKSFGKKRNDPKYAIKEDQRKLIIVEATVRPTSQDTVVLFSKLNALKKSFKKSKNDSLFVMNTAGITLKFYTSGPFSTAVPKSHRKGLEGRYITYPDEMTTAFGKAKEGDVVGPYIFNDNAVIAKVIGRTDEDIEARHILLNNDTSEEDARIFLTKVTNENFAELVYAFTNDKGSKDRGGELGTFFFGDMVPEFATYCAEAPIGQIGFVQTQFGYHIVQVLKRSGNKNPRLAIVQLPFELSEASKTHAKKNLTSIHVTYSKEQSKLDDFSYGKRFKSIVDANSEMANDLNLIDASPRVFDLGSTALADSLLKFAYGTKTSVGDISKIYVDSNRMLLAILAGKSTAGAPTYYMVREDIVNQQFSRARKELLIERLKAHSPAQIKDLTTSCGASLENPQLFGLGSSPKVVAKAIHAYQTGKNGIYTNAYSSGIYIEVVEEKDPIRPMNFEDLRVMLNSRWKANFNAGIDRFLIQSSVIIDNRDLLRLGVRK